MILFGCILVLLNVVNVISTVTTCYPVNGQQYCFYTDGSTVLNRDEARQFCSDRNSTLPIVTDKDIDNVFLQFISDNNLVEVSGSNTQQMNNYVWLDAHAHHVHDSDPWHWINGQPSARTPYDSDNGDANRWVASIIRWNFWEKIWTETLSYICQYQSNCTSTWVEIDNNSAYHRPSEDIYVLASSLKQCQEACEFNRRCVAIDWRDYEDFPSCVIITNSNHEHRTWYRSTHYELVSRCNISTESSCENGFLYKSTCYKIHRERVNWFTAVNRCLSNNASLAVFDDHVGHIPADWGNPLLQDSPLWIGLIKSWWTWPDADCVTWTIEEDYGGAGDKNYTATTVEDCRTECNNNSSCTAIDWHAELRTGRQCWLVGPWTSWSGYRRGIQRHTISRCDVLYNKFNVTSSNPPVNPPSDPESDYNCVVATSRYWRLSRCTDRHRVVCQSVGALTTAAATVSTATPSESTSQFPRLPDDTSSTLTSTALGISTNASTTTSQPGNNGDTSDTAASSHSGLPVKLVFPVAVVVAIVVVAAIVILVVFVVVILRRRRRRRGEQPKPETEDSTGETSLSTTPSSFDPSKPDVVYADIEQDHQLAPGNGDVNLKNTPDNDNEAVTYSELQAKKDADAAGHVVAPSGDLYAKVQKH